MYIHFILFTVNYHGQIWLTDMTSGPTLTHPIVGLHTTNGLRVLLRLWARALTYHRPFYALVIGTNHLYPPAARAHVFMRMIREFHYGSKTYHVWGAFTRWGKHVQMIRRIVIW